MKKRSKGKGPTRITSMTNPRTQRDAARRKYERKVLQRQGQSKFDATRAALRRFP